ncbi:MAG: ROK family protein [Bacillota bacterium]
MYYIGIDIGGMSIKAGIVDENGKLYIKKAIPTEPQRHYTAIVADMAGLCHTICEYSGIAIQKIEGIGIGSPGTVNGAIGQIVYSCNINFDRVPVVEELRKYIDVPTYVDNDANCAAMGEVKFGSCKGLNDAILVTLGTGVGGGIITDGRMLVGKNGGGGEVGHITIKVGGRKCGCGKSGCWEAYASAKALVRQTADSARRNPTSIMNDIIKEQGKVSGRTAFIACRQGDEAGKAVVKKYVQYVSEGLLSLINIFRPDVIAIGGGVSNEGDYFIDMLQEYVDQFGYGGTNNPQTEIRKASLLNDAGILGAAALCI